MKTYKVTSNNDSSYSVTLDDHGVVDVDGLLPSTAEMLKMTVDHYIKTYNLPLLRAFGKAIGPYATAHEIDTEVSVSDLQ
jgi:hypothetical protein